MDQVGELDPVPYEEDGDVVADEIEHPRFRVELRREATYVAHGVGGSARADDRRETGEHGRAPAGSQEVGTGPVGCGVIRFEHTMGSGTAGVHHSLGDALVVEVHDLL